MLIAEVYPGFLSLDTAEKLSLDELGEIFARTIEKIKAINAQ